MKKQKIEHIESNFIWFSVCYFIDFKDLCILKCVSHKMVKLKLNHTCINVKYENVGYHYHTLNFNLIKKVNINYEKRYNKKDNYLCKLINKCQKIKILRIEYYCPYHREFFDVIRSFKLFELQLHYDFLLNNWMVNSTLNLPDVISFKFNLDEYSNVILGMIHDQAFINILTQIVQNKSLKKIYFIDNKKEKLNFDTIFEKNLFNCLMLKPELETLELDIIVVTNNTLQYLIKMKKLKNIKCYVMLKNRNKENLSDEVIKYLKTNFPQYKLFKLLKKTKKLLNLRKCDVRIFRGKKFEIKNIKLIE